MTRTVVLWDEVGNAEPDAADYVARTGGSNKNFHLSVEDLERGAVGLHALATDLVRIAACAFAADQEVGRGSERDVYGNDWKREIVLRVPVSNPGHWSRPAVKELLADTLHFVSGDAWSFEFLRTSEDPLPYGTRLIDVPIEATSVILFSGGADSLAATVAELSVGSRPILVSQRSGSPQNAQQTILRNLLRTHFAPAPLPHLGLPVHRVGRDARETSQRTRSFLFAAAGAAVANAHGLDRVVLADNGVVTLNLPINKQLVGTLASQSTHPKFLTLMNQLLGAALNQSPRVTNPLWDKTKGEVLAVLQEAGAGPLFRETCSCAHPRFKTEMQPHCGVCSQCIDRRFSALATGIEEFDDGARYEIDPFTMELPEGEAKTTVVGYLEFARAVRRLGREELFLEFPELYDALPAQDSNYGQVAATYADMFNRHGDGVVGVLGQAYVRYAEELAKQSLPASSLLRLSGAAESTLPVSVEAPGMQGSLELKGRAWRIRFEGQLGAISDSKGARDLAYLVRNCGKGVAAAELYAERDAVPTAGSASAGLSHIRGLPSGADAEALASYRVRVHELQQEIEGARAAGNADREDRALQELEALEIEIRRTISGSHSARPEGEERARKAVAARIKVALAGMDDGHPQLARHFRDRLQLGAILRYPCPDGLTWEVRN